MLMRAGVALGALIIILGITKMYGHAKYKEGLSACHLEGNQKYQQTEKELFTIYENALLDHSRWRKKALEVENIIDELGGTPHAKIKKVADSSPCEHLGIDVVKLLNSFAAGESSGDLKTSPGHARGKK